MIIKKKNQAKMFDEYIELSINQKTEIKFLRPCIEIDINGQENKRE